jgi:hypothetical protein
MFPPPRSSHAMLLTSQKQQGRVNSVRPTRRRWQRKDFTPSERVAIAAAVEEEMGERRGRPSEENVENFPHLDGAKTRDIAAKKAGFGNPETYQQAKTVVEDGAPELVEAMDSGKASISAASAIRPHSATCAPRSPAAHTARRGVSAADLGGVKIRARRASVRRHSPEPCTRLRDQS